MYDKKGQQHSQLFGPQNKQFGHRVSQDGVNVWQPPAAVERNESQQAAVKGPGVQGIE